MEPIILANSLPCLLNKMVVGTPLKENFFAKVIGESKYNFKFLIFNSEKNFEDFSMLSWPTFIGNILRLFSSSKNLVADKFHLSRESFVFIPLGRLGLLPL